MARRFEGREGGSNRFHFDSTSISFRFRLEFTSNSLRYRFDVTSISLGLHFDVMPISLRFHFDVTSISLRCHFDFTSTSLRFHMGKMENALPGKHGGGGGARPGHGQMALGRIEALCARTHERNETSSRSESPPNLFGVWGAIWSNYQGLPWAAVRTPFGLL